MTNQEAIKILQEKISLCVTGEWKESVDAAISALQAQDLQPTCNNLATDTISRTAAIDVLDAYQVMVENGEEKPYAWARLRMSELPSAQPDVIYCKDCRKHNVSVGYKKDCCALYEWRGISYGHEHDYQYCCHAERKEDELGDK